MASTNNYIANKIADANTANKLFGSTNREDIKKTKNLMEKNSKMHTVYIYSTDTLKRSVSRDDGTKSWPPRGKLGQTFFGNGDVRISQQDATVSFEKPTRLATMDVPIWITDHDIRKRVCSYSKDSIGINYSASRIDKDREWVDFHGESNEEDMIRIWKEAINDIWHGVRAANSFPSHAYQQELIDAIVDRYHAGSKDQLLAAIMRSGKCFITYEVVRKMKFKSVLVITGKTGVNEGWGELLPYGNDPHINYTKWNYHNYNELKKSRFFLMAEETDVLFTSLQYFAKHLDAYANKGVPMPQLVRDILSTEWDLVVFDEQHWGTQTEDTQQLLTQLKWKHKLELSGTAYKTLIQGRYSPEDVHSFDYVDEQKRRFHGTTGEQGALEFRPDINYALINIDPKIKNILSDDGFSFAKLMAVQKGNKHFKNTQHVSDFLNFIKIKVYGNQYVGDMAKFAPYVDRINRHTLWILPNSVLSAEALLVLLENHPYFKGYKIIPAFSSHVKSIDDVKDIINDVDAGKYEGKSKGTITLTLGRFLEGTTVPQWWCVHQMNDDKSAADYFQGSFRTKSEDKKNDKRHVLVYDYNPERFIQVVYTTNVDNNRRKAGQTPSDLIREWCEVSDVYDYDGNSFTILTGDVISNRANQDIKLKMELFQSVAVDSKKINSTLQGMMINKTRQTSWQATSVVNSQDITTTGNQKTVAGSKNSSTQNQVTTPDQVVLTIEKFKQALCKISNAVWCTVDRPPIGSFDDVCTYPDSTFIEQQTGLSTAEWTIWRNSGAINDISQIDRRIDALNESVNI